MSICILNPTNANLNGNSCVTIRKNPFEPQHTYQSLACETTINTDFSELFSLKRGWFGHVERSTGWIAEVRKLNVVAQKRCCRPRKSWDEVLENDKKKLGMDSADPQNRSERTPSRKTCQKAQPSVEENRALKWI